ncbi:glycosyltransferase [Enteractinococcus coprophilus]|nr:glycosyltransferase [Enteractinococcus coprophilus]
MKSPNLITPTEIQRPNKLYRETVRAGVAVTSTHHAELGALLDQISPQVDEVFVYLVGTEAIPETLQQAAKNVRFFSGPDLGPLGKFVFLEDFIGYYIPLDVNRQYGRYHVTKLIAAIESYNRRAVVGWLPERMVATCSQTSPADAPEGIFDRSALAKKQTAEALDCSNIGFHTDTFRFDYRCSTADIPVEISFAQQARQSSVDLIVLHKEANSAPLVLSAISENQAGRAQVAGHRDEETDEPRLVSYSPSLPARRPKRVSIIGRANRARWKKGGILKSVLLTEEMLSAHGCTVELVDIDDRKVFKLDSPDVLIVYVGDPERPDFAKVHKIVEYHAGKGIPTLVNLSEDHFPTRTVEIQKVMSAWQDRFRGLVAMMTFSHNVDSRPEYEAFSSSIVPLPKTLTFSHREYAEYYKTSGIFVGDVAKLSDPRIVGPLVPDMLRKLRAAIPEAKIFGLQQYKSKYDMPKGIDEVWPFMSPADLAMRLTRVRLMVSFPKYATYEMVPVEASALGVPLLYADMPQSLNEAIGFAGYRYRDTFDLINSAQAIYRDPILWRQYSRSGINRAASQDYDVTSAKIYLAVKNFVERHNAKKIWS